jgi:outer membrane protein assembly factor BamA
MGTAEYRFKLPIPKGDATSQYGHVVKFIQGHVKGEIFSDVGEVGGNNTVNDLTSASNMGASVGAGLRFNVPMLGVIRIDYGFPLISSVLGHMTPRFSIGFGNNF